MAIKLKSKNNNKKIEDDHRYLKRLIFKDSLEKLNYLSYSFSSLFGNGKENYIYSTTQGLIFKELHPKFKEIMKREFVKF